MVCHGQRQSGNTSLSTAIKAIPTSMTLSPRQVKPWQCALLLRAVVSTPLARPVACVAPPVQFGRLVQAVGEVSGETPMARPPEYPVPVPRAGYRPRTLSVVLDDPVAVARSLRNHMEPTDLLELIVILAEAAADVAHKRISTQ